MKTQIRLLALIVLVMAAASKLSAQTSTTPRSHNNASNSTPTNNLGFVPDVTNGVSGDKIEETKARAEKGDAIAQQNLGVAYAFGQGVPKDHVEAVKWYRKAAEQDLAEAQFDLGRCYDAGEGVVRDSVEALKWYREAANQGLDRAQWLMGMSYFSGVGVPQDYVEAHKWFNLASSHGLEIAGTCRLVTEKVMTPEQIAEAQGLAREFKPRGRRAEMFHKILSASNPTATGTGFFITDDGYLISNYHVVKDATQVRLLTETGLIAAKVVKVDATNDLALMKVSNKQFNMTAENFLDAPKGDALLQVEVKFSPLPIAASSTVNLGSTVATVGFPDIGLQGFSPKLAKGEIASLFGVQDDPRYFQVSVPVQPGNSGGALVDERGNVVGIVSAKLNAQAALAASGQLPENVNYAVKSIFLLSFLESVPEVSAKLKTPNTSGEQFSDVVKSAQQAAVLVLVY